MPMYLSLGNFALDALGERWATMRGSGGYRWPGYFDTISQRWTYYCAKTEGQNAVVINPDSGPEQNVYAVGKTVDFKSNDNEAFGVLDLKDAYNENVVSYKRGIRLFNDRSRVLLQDDIKAKDVIKSGYWFMHTNARVEISDDGKSAVLIQNGKRMYMEIVSGHENARITVMDAKPLPTSPNPEVQQTIDYGKKIAIDISGVSELQLAIMFIPLEENQAEPSDEVQITDIENWKLTETGASIGTKINSSVALFVNSPLAYKSCSKTYIDAQHTDVKPVIANGCTLVPIRFISEAFGAITNWNEELKTVTISYRDKNISLVIDSDKMLLNGEERTLEAPAQILNFRTFIPLRAVSEALEKEVFWDDSGLIIIGRHVDAQNDRDTIEELKTLLNYRLIVNGEEIKFFSLDNAECNVLVRPDRSEQSTVELKAADSSSEVKIIQPEGATETAYVSVNGRTVKINLLSDKYFYATSEKAIKSITMTDSNFKDMTGVVTWIPANGGVVASSEGAYAVEGICDNNIKTYWSSQGKSNVDFDFGTPKNIYGMSVANDRKNGARKYTFSVEKSLDGKTWEEVLPKTLTSAETDFPEIYELGNVTARFMRFVAHGNSSNEWNIYSELRYYESADQASDDKANWSDYFTVVEWYAMKVGKTMKLAVKGECIDGSETDFSDCSILYKSDNPYVASVSSDGDLSIVKEGTATIIVTIDYHGIVETTSVSIKAIR